MEFPEKSNSCISSQSHTLGRRSAYIMMMLLLFGTVLYCMSQGWGFEEVVFHDNVHSKMRNMGGEIIANSPENGQKHTYLTGSNSAVNNNSTNKSDKVADNRIKLYADDTLSNDDNCLSCLSLTKDEQHCRYVNCTSHNGYVRDKLLFWNNSLHCLSKTCCCDVGAKHLSTPLIRDDQCNIPTKELKVKDKCETQYACDKTMSLVSADCRPQELTNSGDNNGDKNAEASSKKQSTSGQESATGGDKPEAKTKVNPIREACPDPTFLNFTFVTGLFDLHRENWPYFQRDFDHYLNYSIQLLQMNVPLIAFIDAKSVKFVRRHRQHKESFTKLIVTSIEELEYYEDVNIIKEIMDSEEFQTEHAFINHPEAFSPEYNILLNSKSSMLHQASLDNPFNSSHFFWIDMGYGHGEDNVYPDKCDWAPNNLMYNDTVGDKMTFIQLNPISWLSSILEVYKQKVPPFLNGGFFGGSTEAVRRYYNVHKDMYKLLLQHRMTDDDQTVAIVCVFHEKELFNLVDGWWYDVFTLFY